MPFCCSRCPYAHADRLAMVWKDVNLPTYKNHHNASAPGNFHDWDTQNRVFSDMAAVGARQLEPHGQRRTDARGRRSGVGRAFSLCCRWPRSSAVRSSLRMTRPRRIGALLAHGFWLDRFGGDPKIVAKPFG